MNKRSILLISFVCLILQGQAQRADSSYWQENMQPLELVQDSGYESFAMLDTVVDKYRFFFTAEQHWKTVNTRIQFAFLTYLHQHAGVKNLIVEGGFSYGFLINRYLETGDKRLLHKVLTDIPVCPDNLENMYEKLRKYNQQLPPEDRIQVTGIDLEYSPEIAIQSLYTLMPEGEAPERIAGMMEKVQALHASKYYDKKEVKRFFKRLHADIGAHPEAYKTFWDTQFDLFNLIVENTLHGYKFNPFLATALPATWQRREERMYANFLVMTRYMKPGNYYAQFGALHTDIRRSLSWDFHTLAHRLNFYEDSPVNHQVLTISRYLRQTNEGYDRLGESEALRRMASFGDRRFPGQVVLCSMVGLGSPFQQLSETFQYILLIDPELEKESCD